MFAILERQTQGYQSLLVVQIHLIVRMMLGRGLRPKNLML
jgi:hypothetical protein